LKLPAVKLLLLSIILCIQVASAATRVSFDYHLSELLKPYYPQATQVTVSSNLNAHQLELVKSISDLTSIKLMDNNHKKITSHSLLLLKFRSNRKIKFVKIPTNIKILQNIWLTKRAVSRKEPINRDDLYQQEQDILQLNGKPFIPGNGRYIYVSNLNKNSVLTTWKVKQAYDIIKSDKINAQVYGEGVELKFIVTALQSGFIGDRILVKFPSGKKLRGRVIDMQTVRVKI